jgi:microcystin-dependent protein
MSIYTANVYGQIGGEPKDLPYIKKTGDTATGLIIFDGGLQTNIGAATFNAPVNVNELLTLTDQAEFFVDCVSNFNKPVSLNNEVTTNGDILQIQSTTTTFVNVANATVDFNSPVSCNNVLGVGSAEGLEIGNGSRIILFGNSSIQFDPGTLPLQTQTSAYTGAAALAGTYTNVNMTINNQGAITAISNGTGSAPVGTVWMWGGFGSTPPAGWLLCDGDILDNTSTYAALFATIGNVYNTSSLPANQFQLPNFTSRLPMGPSVNNDEMKITFNDGSASYFNAYQGSNFISSSNMIPQHTHPIGQSGDYVYNVNATTDCSTGGDKSRVYSVSERSFPANTLQNTFTSTQQSMFLPRVAAVNFIIKF